jgi:hypothetical protein
MGDGADKTDKGIYKALTGAYKYMLMQVFGVIAGDDPEATDEQGNPTNKPIPSPQNKLVEKKFYDYLKSKNIVLNNVGFTAKEQSAKFGTMPANEYLGSALTYWVSVYDDKYADGKEKGSLSLSNVTEDLTKYIETVFSAASWADIQPVCKAMSVALK